MIGRARVNLAWLLSDKIYKTLIALLATTAIARHLGPEQYGYFSYASAVIGILSVISVLGLPPIIAREVASNRKNATTLMSSSAALVFVAGVLLYILALTAVLFFQGGGNQLIVLIAILGPVLPLKVAANFQSALEARSRSAVSARASIYSVTISSILKLIFAGLGLPTPYFALAVLLDAAIFAILIAFASAKNRIRFSILRIKLREMKEISKEGLPLLLMALSISLYTKLDQIMIGEMMSAADVGIYAISVKIHEAANYIPVAICVAFFPFLAKAKRKDEAEYQRYAQKLFNLLAVVSLIVSAIAIVLAGVVIELLFGDLYRGSTPVLRWHISGLVFVAFGVGTSRILVIEKRTNIALMRSVLGAILNVGLNLVLIPMYGLVGAAAATVFSQFVVGVVSDLFAVETRYLLRVKWRALWFWRTRRDLLP